MLSCLVALVATLGCAAGFACSAPALAATPEAWSPHRDEVFAKCSRASGLKDAKLAGELVECDDSIGFTAAMLEGTYPQPHMRNQPGRSLCLFDKRSRTANAAPADSLK